MIIWINSSGVALGGGHVSLTRFNVLPDKTGVAPAGVACQQAYASHIAAPNAATPNPLGNSCGCCRSNRYADTYLKRD